MSGAPRLLGGLTPSAFLRTVWQRSPRLVRGAMPSFRPPLGPEDLQGIACRPDANARIVLHDEGEGWEVREGPFDAADFRGLPDAGWTLLVQEVDRHVAEVGRLLDGFRFLPNWRIDDVMVSYAAPGGGVGPHVDAYDVFLLQGHGRRRWRVRTGSSSGDDLVPGIDLRVLRRFDPDESWDLDPGDMLYLPPGVAHEGVAVEACMTYSIGFRAPSETDLAMGWLGERLRAGEGERFADPGRRGQREPGEIRRADLNALRALLRRAAAADEETFSAWFGRFVTEPRREGQEEPPELPPTADALDAALRAGATLRRSAVSRFAFVRTEAGATLFVGGESYDLPGPLAAAAPLLSGRRPLTAANLEPVSREAAGRDLLAELVGRGFLILDAAGVRG